MKTNVTYTYYNISTYESAQQKVTSNCIIWLKITALCKNLLDLDFQDLHQIALTRQHQSIKMPDFFKTIGQRCIFKESEKYFLHLHIFLDLLQKVMRSFI